MPPPMVGGEKRQPKECKGPVRDRSRRVPAVVEKQLLASTKGQVEHLCLTGPKELHQILQGPDGLAEDSTRMGPGLEKALALV